MATIVVKNQKELDALPLTFKEFTYIEIRSDRTTEIRVSKNYGSASVVAYGSASVRAYGSASVVAYDSASVRAFGSASVLAYGSASVRASDSASVVACDSASVRASGSASVRAYDSASVVACDSASVVAYGSASVRAYGSASVVACDSASVRAYGNSMISVLSALVIIHKIKEYSIIALDGVKIKLPKKDKTATVIIRKLVGYTLNSFVDIFNLVEEDKSVILYKTVNKETLCDFSTNSLKYEGIVKCPDFDPDTNRECGGGLHLCATKEGAIDFAAGPYKLLKCRVKLKDIVVYGKSIQKVRCKQVEVLEVVGEGQK
jgi:hypothetical protein